MKYEDIRSELKTGDVLLFSGKGFVSWLIKLATFSQYSHVGMVYVIGRGVYCWESTSISKHRDGVQISLLSNRLLSYKGTVSVRRLETNRDSDFYNSLEDFRQQVKGRKYEQNIWELMGAALPWRNTVNLVTIFCSELVAAAWQRMKVLKDDKPSNEYTPADFGSGNICEDLNNSVLSQAISLEI